MNFDTLNIDKHNLDEEWLAQPILMAEIIKEAALANKIAKKAKARSKVKYSELVLEAKADPDLLGGVSATEGTIKAWAEKHKDHQKALKKQYNAEHDSEVLTQAVFAYQHRKATLEHLTSLYFASYFSSPKRKRKKEN